MGTMVDKTLNEKHVHDGGSDDKNDARELTRMTSAKSEENGYRNMNRRLPLDRGWAWVVLFACFIELAAIVGYFKCFGIFFVQLQRRFRSSSAATSVIFSLQNAFYSISALLVMNLGHAYSSRFFVVLGGIVVTLSFVITGFVEDLKLAYVTAGVMSGSFLGCIQPHISTMLNTYFEKRRGLANNLAGSGVSIGALSLAPLYTSAFAYYGFTGTYFIAAGVTLQVVVVGCLLRPMEFYQTKRRSVNSGSDSSSIALARTHREETSRNGSLVISTSEEIVVLFGSDNELPVMHKQGNSCNGVATERVLSETGCSSSLISESEHIEKKAFIASVEYSSSFASQRNGEANKDDIDDIHQTKHSNKSRNPVLKFLSPIKEQLLNNRVIKKRVFLYFLLCNFFVCSGCTIVEGFIAPHAVDVDIDNQRVAILISVIAIADICCKFVVGYLSDSKMIKRTAIMALAAIGLGVCSFFMYFLNTFATLVVYCVVTGCLQPVYYALYPVIAVDILSLKDLKSALGFIAVTQGVSTCMLFPVAGYLRDTTGRYHATFAFAGCLLLIGGTLCYFLPNFKAFCDRRKAKTVNADRENSHNVEANNHNTLK